MKKCPQCSKTFPDDKLVCLYDRATLIPGDREANTSSRFSPRNGSRSAELGQDTVADAETDAIGIPEPTSSYNPRETVREAVDDTAPPVMWSDESIKSPSRYVTRPSLARPSDSFEQSDATVREFAPSQAHPPQPPSLPSQGLASNYAESFTPNAVQIPAPAEAKKGSKALRVAAVLLSLAVVGTGFFAYFIYDQFFYTPTYYTPTNTLKPAAVSPDKIASSSTANERSDIDPERQRKAKESYDNGVKHQEQATRLMQAGLKDEADSENQKAIIQYREAIVADPRMAAAHENIGVALYNTGDFEGAVSEYESALKLILAPTSQLFTNYAYGLLGLKRFHDAADAFGRALQIEPSDYDLHFYRGSALYFAREIESSRNAYAEYLRLAPDGQYAEQARDFLAGRSVPVESGVN